ncbi:hypothetical protein K4F52_002398 [Lecanicillium sp. MT-2017a]|nr:hypothetical protein K4F52_002398 [Lecanicillium sp. MT-2017a]
MSYAKETYPLHGACACGQTTYTVSLAPLIVHCCHCTSCQRQLGSSYAINALVEAEAVTAKFLPLSTSSGIDAAFARLTASTAAISLEEKNETRDAAATKLPAEENSKTDVTAGRHNQLERTTVPTESHRGQTMVSCPACHTVLWSHYDGSGPHLAFVRVGTLDEPHRVQPDAHIYTRSKSPFITMSDGKPQFEGYYEDRKAFYRPETLDRVAALEVKVAEYKKQLQG